ncbi:Ligand-binding SRPBCC domain-containing protein [Rubritalea squalenifaciens DSM 18772]|uniref:Ligand-binding SRPBCC domain-containing protein n=1 Tax=Rubritalea squalenifaciens DSM 18772 TaxID=1123071 RepID=A0A1M6STH7_9BACT|nr:SRPBCC family protein [Rubritalea squalenifaciens]SHK47995.1 Ligand-binding SRPBCC domain-containing protein [Rubritalea squalenifaciens DSM 18772]
MYHLHREQQLNCTPDEAWEFFSNPKNLDKLTPDAVGFKITHCQSEHMHEGQIIAYKVKVAPLIWVTWVTEITQVADKKHFIDDQRVGPYALWHHTHRFEENDQGVYMIDDVNYALPLGPIGRIAHALYVKKQLQHIFDERYRLAEEIFNA